MSIHLAVEGFCEIFYSPPADPDARNYPPQLCHHIDIVDKDRIIHIFPNRLGRSEACLRVWITDKKGNPDPDETLKQQSQNDSTKLEVGDGSDI